MRTLKIALTAAVGSLALTGAAQAQDEGPSFSFNVAGYSDYVFRGFSQTDEDPALQGGVDASFGIGYAGAWASTVDFGDSTDVEFDLYAGVKPTVGAVTLDLGVIYYGYADQPSGADYDYWEFKAAGSVPAGPASVGVAVYYSPEFFGDTGDAWYYEANAAVSIPDTRFSLSGAIGRQEVDLASDYTTWNAGVGVALTDNLSLDVRYWDTNVSEAASGGLADARVVAGLKFAW